MAVLIETRLNALKLNENAKPRKGCLGRLEGICADFKNPTRNGRLYPLKLWKNVFDDPIFKESLNSKTLLGELDHPEDRLEVLAGEACIVMTDYRIDEDAGVIYAGFDILDTPRGKILKTLLDYGCVMGVSSRGQGDISNTADGEVVDEDTYDFACFDVVTTPAVEKARQNVVESVKKTRCFVESIKRQITEAETIGDLNAIKRVVTLTQSAESDSLLESIQNKCDSIKEGKTITSNSDELQTNTTSNTVINESVKQVDDVNATKTKDTEDVSAKTISEHRELFSCLNDMRKQISAYKHREKRLVKVIECKDSQIKNLESLNEQLKSVRYANSKLKGQVEKLKSLNDRQTTDFKESVSNKNRQLTTLNNRIDSLNSSLNEQVEKTDVTKKRLNTITEQLNSSKNSIQKLQREISAKEHSINKLETSISDKDNTVNALQESVNSYKRRVKKDEHTIATLNNEIQSLNEKLNALVTDMNISEKESTMTTGKMELEINQYAGLVDSLHEEVNTLKSQLSESTSTNKKLENRMNKLNEQLKIYQQNYINTKSRQFGIDADSVKKFVTVDTSVSQVNKIVEELQQTKDRYAKLPISESMPKGVTLKSTAITNDVEDEETARLTRFVEQVTNANK